MIKATDSIMAIGASTGRTEAVKEVLEVLLVNTPPTLTTQPMTEYFTKIWADRVYQIFRILVKEAEDGDSVLPGHALIRSGARYSVGSTSIRR